MGKPPRRQLEQLGGLLPGSRAQSHTSAEQLLPAQVSAVDPALPAVSANFLPVANPVRKEGNPAQMTVQSRKNPRLGRRKGT
jgi:hypothetical protein